MYVYFLLYVYYIYVLYPDKLVFQYLFTFSLNVVDLPFFFIMPVTTIFTITFYLNMPFFNFGM